MKKFLSLLLALLLIPAATLASGLDLSVMTDEELEQLQDAVTQELAARKQAKGVLAVWDTPLAHVELVGIRRGLTKEGGPGLALTFSYTNNSDDIDTFRTHHWVTLYHDGIECERVIFLDDVLVDTESWGKKIMPGKTLNNMTWFFAIPGSDSTVDVEIDFRSPTLSKSAGIFTIELPSD